MKRKNTEEAEAETRKNAEAAAEELATDEHGMTRKNTEEGRRIIDSDRKRERRTAKEKRKNIWIQVKII